MWEDFSESLEALRRKGRFRQLRPMHSDGVYLTDSQGRRTVNFGSNDYLGLAGWLAERMPPAASIGSRASGLVCGWTDRHARLADRIAAFEQSEAAVVFPSGFAACSGTVATLCRDGDLILSDQLNHASLIDGCRLSKAHCQIYAHRDVDHVADVLERLRSQFRRVWIVTDSVFSMDGHLAPLCELVDLAERFDAELIVDEAHATGILGTRGSGACEALGVKQQVAVRIGTLSKALGAQGGFVACDGVVADMLVNHCRPFIFSTSLAMPAVEAALLALEDPGAWSTRRDRVRGASERFRSELGLTVQPIEREIPIIPIFVGTDRRAVALSQRLYDLGMFVPAIRPPTVPEGQARLRVSLTASHDDAMIDCLIESLRTL